MTLTLVSSTFNLKGMMSVAGPPLSSSNRVKVAVLNTSLVSIAWITSYQLSVSTAEFAIELEETLSRAHPTDAKELLERPLLVEHSTDAGFRLDVQLLTSARHYFFFGNAPHTALYSQAGLHISQPMPPVLSALFASARTYAEP